MLWEIDIHPGQSHSDYVGEIVSREISSGGFGSGATVRSARGFLLQGDLNEAQVDQVAKQLLADTVVEQPVIGSVGDASLSRHPDSSNKESVLLHVMPKPGVTDAVAQSAHAAIRDEGLPVEAVSTLKKYWISGLTQDQIENVAKKLLSNDSIEQTILGPLNIKAIQLGQPYELNIQTIEIRSSDADQLTAMSKERQLSMTLPELQTVQSHFRQLKRDPTDAELETIAQTWSEHCSHKTLAGRIAYRDDHGERRFENMLKETIFAATMSIREQLDQDDWCVSVFKDNAGIIQFDDKFHLAFKVETHNRPSALEPYGGANTGIGGVIRDTLGTGLGAKPIANTDVFCFADPRLESSELPPGVLHPKRIMQGVVSGVRDYGNRMGIPTVNGAVYFDQRYVGNPLVFCGNVGVIPVDKAFKEPQPGDFIVSIGGRTGRDGIHGATFSSAELTSESDTLSGGAVQIGNAITEKMVADVLLQARDEELYSAITDCGAGGFSSAVGEMGEEIGAEVWLDKAPLKYEGLSYTEIWISEAQERMVCAVPEEKWPRFKELCDSESVEATIIGRFEPTGRLVLKYGEEIVGDLEMEFLHQGRPPIVREAIFQAPATVPMSLRDSVKKDYSDTLLELLASPNVASKEWIIRQYDHEVQAGSVIKPLVGVDNDGPSDAAVVRPRLDSYRAAVIACGMNPLYGDSDPYHMAASAIDEAFRNCIAVGADPRRIALLDNFCWGYTDRPETLGKLVRAALACQELSVAFKAPFISGKDSLNNEYSYVDEQGERQTISIPSTLLISALGQVEDARRCVTMDLKQAGNLLYVVGATKNEFGGSHFGMVENRAGGLVPTVNPDLAMAVFHAVHQAIMQGQVKSCHDLSEGGLAVALAEMAFAGGLGVICNLDCMELSVEEAELSRAERDLVRLFSESNSRFVCEVPVTEALNFEQNFSGVPLARIGTVDSDPTIEIRGESTTEEGDFLLQVSTVDAKARWQGTLDW